MFQNEFEKQRAVNNECDAETQKTDDELFFEVVGGWNDKGRVFGLGAAAQSYYDRPIYGGKNAKTLRRDYIKSLESQVVELATKNDEQKKELDTTKEGLVATQTELVQTQKVLIETQESLSETNKSFSDFRKQVEQYMQANPHNN